MINIRRRKHIFKLMVGIILMMNPAIASGVAYSVTDLGTGPFFFNDSGQVIHGSRGRVGWDDTPYNKAAVLDILNRYFAPDYQWGSSWDDATIFDINDSGQAVGMIIYSSVNFSFLLDGIKLSVFGGWSSALAINNYGQIVGDNQRVNYLTNAAVLPDIHDFIPQSGSIYISSLDASIPEESIVFQANDWEQIGAATDINNFGQILGVGKRLGMPPSYYLLTPDAVPVPEPSLLILLGTCFCGFVLWKRTGNNLPIKQS